MTGLCGPGPPPAETRERDWEISSVHKRWLQPSGHHPLFSEVQLKRYKRFFVLFCTSYNWKHDMYL